MSAGPEEKVRALKLLIEHHLNSTGVTDRIDRALRERDKDNVIQDITRFVLPSGILILSSSHHYYLCDGVVVVLIDYFRNSQCLLMC